MEGNKQLDLGGFTLYDSSAIQKYKDREELDKRIQERTIENVQHIFNSIVEAKKQEIATIEALPQQEQIHDFNVSRLFMKIPQVATMFPRSRKLPQQKSMTKWQTFAKQKGIKKQKRNAHVYDKTRKDYTARWGSKSSKNLFEPAIMEQKQPGRNPFQDAKNQRRLTKQKHKLKQLKNQEAALKKIKPSSR